MGKNVKRRDRCEQILIITVFTRRSVGFRKQKNEKMENAEAELDAKFKSKMHFYKVFFPFLLTFQARIASKLRKRAKRGTLSFVQKIRWEYLKNR